MEVSALQAAPQASNHYARDDMDIDMDIDIDLGVEDYMEPELETQIPSNPFAPTTSNLTIPADPVAEQPADPVPEKVHVRGLDNLSSADVKQFAADHFSLDQFVRIEWIDDTSANLTYGTPEAGADALAALTNTEALSLGAIDIPLLQLRLGRKLSTHPNSELFVRQATTIDVKKKGASDASRYYLLHPEKAFRDRKGPRDGRRGRFRQDSEDSGDYNRTRFDDREQKRRRDERGAGFDANMYDDDAGETEDSGSMGDSRKRARTGRGRGDLFADRLGRSTGGRLRDRSASPTYSGDGLMGFGTDEYPVGQARRKARQRSTSPRLPLAKKNNRKELFPSLASYQSTLAENPVKELFPTMVNASTSLPSSVELFPNKRQSFSNHRRSNAFDASENDRAGFERVSPLRERTLEQRVTARPSSASTSEIRVRGAAGDVGFSIRGMAGSQPPSVKELFPSKVGGNNSGKELFGERIKGRGVPRRKAEDMFH